jgi:hypothetical protein
MNPLCIDDHHLLLFIGLHGGCCCLHAKEIPVLHLNAAPSFVDLEICVPQLA